VSQSPRTQRRATAICAQLLALACFCASPAIAAEPEVVERPESVSVTALTVVVTAPSGARALQGLSVELDGLPIAAGESVALRPGAHRVEVRAPGFYAEGRNVQVAPTQKLMVSFTLTPKHADDSAAIEERALAARAAAETAPLHPQVVAGIVIGVMGVLSGAASGIAYAVHHDTRADVQLLVRSGRCTEDAGGAVDCESPEDRVTVEALDDKSYQAVVSSVALGAGAAFLVGLGLALALTAPSTTPTKTVQLRWGVEPVIGIGTYGARASCAW